MKGDMSKKKQVLDDNYFSTKVRFSCNRKFYNDFRRNFDPKDYKVYGPNLSKFLAKKCSSSFKKWWDPKKFNWVAACDFLPKKCSKHFLIWWKDYEYCGDKVDIIRYCSKYFDVWYNKKDFPLKFYSGELSRNCRDHFDKWWDPKKFNWADSSSTLLDYCHEIFDKWWDPDRFNWDGSSSELCDLIPIKKWWNPEKFNWMSSSSSLADRCTKHFDLWWNPDKYYWCEDGTEVLIYRLKNKIKTWWDPLKFDWTYHEQLVRYCKRYKDIWETDYYIKKIEGLPDPY
jgi:hypothetical protein